MIEDTPWCMVSQLPHSPLQCMVAKSSQKDNNCCDECNEPNCDQDDVINMFPSNLCQINEDYFSSYKCDS